MIDPNTELQHGGRVRISGQWHDVKDHHAFQNMPNIEIGPISINAAQLMPVIEDYEQPKPKPFEWVERQIYKDIENRVTTFTSINAALTATHGDPTIRTYRGEESAQFGLDSAKARVLYWDKDQARWFPCTFAELETGEQWRKLPAGPEATS